MTTRKIASSHCRSIIDTRTDSAQVFSSGKFNDARAHEKKGFHFTIAFFGTALLPWIECRVLIFCCHPKCLLIEMKQNSFKNVYIYAYNIMCVSRAFPLESYQVPNIFSAEMNVQRNCVLHLAFYKRSKRIPLIMNLIPWTWADFRHRFFFLSFIFRSHLCMCTIPFF